ncbi:flagellar protein FlaG [Desulfovirgula thermocuniculi]|uniref:flagellar protein FlaG n=1 Tax=Desulfovirgula thermocuniculi TaxID=348842 RepID=UPI00040CC971|nr:flagellar protein FlaG [Desulfovirgula thermocuniculi]
MEKVGSVGERQGIFFVPERPRLPGGEVAPAVKKEKESSLMPPEDSRDGQRPTLEEIREALGQINETLRIYRTELRFVLHEESGEYMVKVINAETQEVIREIPPEWVLKIVASVKRMLGLILDKFI